MNRVAVIGNLTQDPVRSETQTGVVYCRFSVAVNRTFAKDENDRKVDFFPVMTWRGVAENCGRYLKKGSKVAIEGRIENQTYKTKDGEDKTTTIIVAENVEFLSPDLKNESEPRRSTAKQAVLVEDDDCPF